MEHFLSVEIAVDGRPIFGDAALQARRQLKPGSFAVYNYENFCDLGPDGMPLGDYEQVFLAGEDASGTWHVQIGGSVDLSIPYYANTYAFSSVPGRPSFYDAATHTTEFLMTLAPGASDISLQFGNTRRNAGDAPGTSLRYVRMWRPSAPGSSTPLPPGTLFVPQTVEGYEPAAGIRPMGFGGTNRFDPQPRAVTTAEPNPQQRWADRVLPSYARQSNGGAWEYMVALANATNSHLWINIPVNAETAYIEALAAAIERGTDGVNPVAPGVTPTWAGLKPGLKVYWELSNEDWNTPTFATFDFYVRMGKAVPPGTGINADGVTTNDTMIAWFRYKIAEFVRASDTIRSVVGDSAMNSRWNGLISIQQDYYPEGLLIPMLQFAAGHFPHPIAHYAKGFATGGYRFFDGVDSWGKDTQTGAALTLDQAFARPLAAVNHAQIAALAATYGLILAVYEGSPAPNGVPYPPPPFVVQACSDPRIVPLVTQVLDDARAAGVALFSYFERTEPPWSLSPTMYDLDAPKFLAWRAAIDVSAPPSVPGRLGVARQLRRVRRLARTAEPE